MPDCKIISTTVEKSRNRKISSPVSHEPFNAPDSQRGKSKRSRLTHLVQIEVCIWKRARESQWYVARRYKVHCVV